MKNENEIQTLKHADMIYYRMASIQWEKSVLNASTFFRKYITLVLIQEIHTYKESKH